MGAVSRVSAHTGSLCPHAATVAMTSGGIVSEPTIGTQVRSIEHQISGKGDTPAASFAFAWTHGLWVGVGMCRAPVHVFAQSGVEGCTVGESPAFAPVLGLLLHLAVSQVLEFRSFSHAKAWEDCGGTVDVPHGEGSLGFGRSSTKCIREVGYGRLQRSFGVRWDVEDTRHRHQEVTGVTWILTQH